jgi:hypothetical protein
MATGIMTHNEQMMARIAIQHTLSVYNNAGDRGAVPELLHAFAPDGVLEIGTATYAGREGIGQFITYIANGGDADMVGSRHHITTSRIEFTSQDSARGWTYFFVMRRGSVLQEGLYIDRFALTTEGWLIAHRRVKMLYRAGD